MIVILSSGVDGRKLIIQMIYFIHLLTFTCNSTDYTTPYICDINVPSILHSLEIEVTSIDMCFPANYMKHNADKSHFLISGNAPEELWVKVGNEMTREMYLCVPDLPT